jgi:hypothetical protein
MNPKLRGKYVSQKKYYKTQIKWASDVVKAFKISDVVTRTMFNSMRKGSVSQQEFN